MGAFHKFTYKVLVFAPAVSRGFFMAKGKHIFPGMGVMCFK